MEQEISSGETVTYKFIQPIIVNAGCAPIAYYLLRAAAKEITAAIVALIFIAIALNSLRLARQIKKIGMDDYFLYVYSGSQKYKTPLTNIAEVKESTSGHPKFVTLVFKQRTEFGSKVVFIPKFEQVSMFRRKFPVLDELRWKAGINTFRMP
jgi:hypothetical protein